MAIAKFYFNFCFSKFKLLTTFAVLNREDKT